MYLYILVQTKKKHFKIGVTKDIKNRFLDLSEGWGLFDLGKSFYIEAPADVIRSLECVLMHVYSKYNMNYKKGKPGGYTEFFKITCLSDVKRTIKTLKFGIKKIDFKITDSDVREWGLFKARNFAGVKNKINTKRKRKKK